jgi:NhaP-type Na+/H+ or K+/H+ antiporter
MVMELILALAVMLVTGFLGGELTHRLRFPRITGYLVVGIIFSPSLLNVIPKATVDNLDVFTFIALGIIAYSIGASLDLKLIRQFEKSILWITPFQSLGALLLVTLLVALLAPFILAEDSGSFLSFYFPLAFVLGAMASATAPATILALVHELKASGPLTTTLLSLVALDDGLAIIFFSIALAVAQPLVAGAAGFSLWDSLAIPVVEILGAVLLGIILAYGLIYLARLVRSRALLLVAVLGAILLAVGLSELWGVSLILANMTIGFVAANWAKRPEMFVVIDDIEDVIFVLFFVLAGLHFDLDAMTTGGLLALLIVVGRFSGKYFGTKFSAHLSAAPEVVRKYLGLALLPKAGVTIGLALLAEQALPSFGTIIFNAVLASVIINELIAPPLAKYALIKSGETRTE